MPAQLQHAPSSSSLHQAGGIQAARGVSALAEICAPPPFLLCSSGERLSPPLGRVHRGHTDRHTGDW